MLSQLSYTPVFTTYNINLEIPNRMVGLIGIEPMTSPLSGVRSSQLSYRPEARYCTTSIYLKKCVVKQTNKLFFLRKEVIQPLVPQRLPCYDFTPITGHTFEGCPPCGLAHQLRVQQAFVV